MDRPTLYSWTAVRSGASITVTHSCGKVVNVTGIGVIDGDVIATRNDGAPFLLHVPARVPAPLGATENIGSVAAD